MGCTHVVSRADRGDPCSLACHAPVPAVGMMTVRAANLNVTCPLPPGSAGASGSSGVPAYVWALVGLAAAGVVAGAAAAALLVRRRRRLQRASSSGRHDEESPSKPSAAAPADADTEGEHGDQPGSPASPALERGASMGHAPSGELQDGLWRNRCVLPSA